MSTQSEMVLGRAALLKSDADTLLAVATVMESRGAHSLAKRTRAAGEEWSAQAARMVELVEREEAKAKKAEGE